jgi:hypothetical protein
LGEQGMRPRLRRPTRRSSGGRTSEDQPGSQNKLRSGQLSKPVETTYALEAHALGVLLRRPDQLYKVDRALQAAGLARLTPADFQHADHQTIFRLLHESVDQDMAEPLNYVMNSLSLPMMELADGLLERTKKLDPNEDRVLSDLLRTLLDLRSRNLHQSIDYLRFLMEDAQQQGDFKASQYQQTMVQHTVLLYRLNRAIGQYTSRTPVGR